MEAVVMSYDGNLIVTGYLAKKFVTSCDRRITTCGSLMYDYVQQRKTMIGEPVCEQMRWRKGLNVLVV